MPPYAHRQRSLVTVYSWSGPPGTVELCKQAYAHVQVELERALYMVGVKPYSVWASKYSSSKLECRAPFIHVALSETDMDGASNVSRLEAVTGAYCWISANRRFTR